MRVWTHLMSPLFGLFCFIFHLIPSISRGIPLLIQLEKSGQHSITWYLTLVLYDYWYSTSVGLLMLNLQILLELLIHQALAGLQHQKGAKKSWLVRFEKSNRGKFLISTWALILLVNYMCKITQFFNPWLVTSSKHTCSKHSFNMIRYFPPWSPYLKINYDNGDTTLTSDSMSVLLLLWWELSVVSPKIEIPDWPTKREPWWSCFQFQHSKVLHRW